MKEYKIASIAGDGIGQEVVPEAHKVLKKVAEEHQFKLSIDDFDFASCDYYEKHGKMLPDDWKDKIGKHDAIFFGAVGDEKIADDITLWGLRLNICQGLDQFANVRPSKYIEGINSPLKKEIAKKIDWIIVRENSEGEYAGSGGIVHKDLPIEIGSEELSSQEKVAEEFMTTPLN